MSSNEKTQRVDNRFHLIYLPLSSGWGWRALKPWRERELKRGTRLVWREKLGIERVPLRFAVFPPNRRAISHCSLMTTSPTRRAPAATAADPIFIWFNILTPEERWKFTKQSKRWRIFSCGGMTRIEGYLLCLSLSVFIHYLFHLKLALKVESSPRCCINSKCTTCYHS